MRVGFDHGISSCIGQSTSKHQGRIFPSLNDDGIEQDLSVGCLRRTISSSGTTELRKQSIETIHIVRSSILCLSTARLSFVGLRLNWPRSPGLSNVTYTVQQCRGSTAITIPEANAVHQMFLLYPRTQSLDGEPVPASSDFYIQCRRLEKMGRTETHSTIHREQLIYKNEE